MHCPNVRIKIKYLIVLGLQESYFATWSAIVAPLQRFPMTRSTRCNSFCIYLTFRYIFIRVTNSFTGYIPLNSLYPYYRRWNTKSPPPVTFLQLSALGYNNPIQEHKRPG
jgi:hypothetical protein